MDEGAVLRARIGVKVVSTVRYGQFPCEMPQRIIWLREQLLSWFEHHGRSFPWREPGRSSYVLVVAEILLQRTTTAKVARAFPGFIARYPTWEALARTPLEELQTALRPLGLWRQKAQVFLDLADVVEKNRGELPLCWLLGISVLKRALMLALPLLSLCYLHI